MHLDRYQLADRRRARKQRLGTIGVILLGLAAVVCVVYAVLYL